MRALSLRVAGGCAALAALAMLLGLSARLNTGFDAAILASLCSTDGGASNWTFDGWITLPLAAIAILYAAGTLRLRARVWAWPRQIAFMAGLLTLVAALVSPLHRWGTGFFTAHMIEHELVMAVAAPLLVLARPAGQILWGLPQTLRRWTARAMTQKPVRTGWLWLTAPLMATVVHGAAIWLWHVPFVFESALATVALHRLQHVLFLGTAILFWWAIWRRCEPGVAALHLFATMLHMSILGALIALAPRVLFPLQTANAGAWGFTPLEDQQLAGLLMWIPAGTVYAGACLACAAAWIRRASTRAWRAPHAVPPA